MGWYSCYTALKEKKCNTAMELFKKHREAYISADRTNIRRDRTRAWIIAERHLQKEIMEEK